MLRSLVGSEMCIRDSASTMHRSIVFASRQSGGVGFRHPRIEQGISQLIKCVQSLRTPGYSQDLLRLSISELQVNSGMSFDLLRFPSRPCPHLEGTWLRSLRQFLSSVQGSLETSCFKPIPLQRQGDLFLMDLFVSRLALGRRRLQRLNSCRLFLAVSLVSEITNVAGTHLLPEFWCGLGPRPCPPLTTYPRQGCPSSAVWAEWRAAIRKVLCLPRSTQLRHPLGPWHSSSARFPAITSHPLRLWMTSKQYHQPQFTTSTYYQFSSSPCYGRVPPTSTCLLYTSPSPRDS